LAAKKKAKAAAVAEKAPAAPAPKEKKEENKEEQKTEAAAAPASKPPAKGKGKAKAKGKAEGKAEAKAASRKTKARRLEEAQASVDAEDDDEGSAAAAASDEPRGVVYVGHIPDGFFEPQMKKYFSQFGKVTRVRHSRAKKNAASRGYGWVEFAEEAVAKIAQQTMNGYLMFGKKMICEMVPPEKVHPALFKNANKRMVDYSKSRRTKAREAHNNRPTAEVDGETIPRMTLRQAARRGKSDKRLASVLKGMEVSFDLDSANYEASEGDEIVVAAGGPKRGTKRPQEKTPSSPKTKAVTPGSPKAKAKAKGKDAAEAKASKKRKKA